MRMLFLGDVVGRSGRTAVMERLPGLRERYALDFVVVNGENAAGGFGITEPILNELLDAGADVVTTGNHVFDQREALVFIERHDRLLRPLNFPLGTPGKGAGLFKTRSGAEVLVINAQGRVFMADLDDPFRAVERELDACGLKSGADAILIDFHAEATSEKEALGHFVDGRVSAVIGTHTHVPTADEQILGNGTAYISDAGMCGDFNSVLGMDKEEPIQRFLTKIPTGRFAPSSGEATLCGVAIEVDDATGLARAVAPLRLGGRLTQTEPAFFLPEALGRTEARSGGARRPAVDQETLQAEDRLVEMKQGAVGIAGLVEQRQARLGDMIGGLGAELRQRERGHHLVLRFGGGGFGICVMVPPFRCQARKPAISQAFNFGPLGLRLR